MFPKDEEVLKEIFLNYSPQLILKRMSILALEVASECSDLGLKDRSKELTRLSSVFERLSKQV